MTSGTRKARSTPPRRASTGEQAPFELKPWHIQAIVTAFALFFFRDILLGKAFLWEDFLYYSYPVRSFAATSMAMGQFPLWNPYTFNGIPFLADIQTTVLYLPCTILALAVKNGSLHFGWLELVIVLHYVLAGISMAALARFLELRPVPSLFASVAFMLSGFMIVHSIHQQIITLVAWYPLITLLFLRALRDQRWFWVFLAALALGHSIFAGYPQLSLYLYLFLFALFVFELLRINGPKGLLKSPALVMSAKAAAIVILSVAVAMVQLLPTAELADLSQRAQITYEKGKRGLARLVSALDSITAKDVRSGGTGCLCILRTRDVLVLLGDLHLSWRSTADAVHPFPTPRPIESIHRISLGSGGVRAALCPGSQLLSPQTLL